MKKYIIALFTLLLTLSCEEYLDKAPDAGMQENDVFERYSNFKAYFDAAYDGQEKNSNGDNRQVNIRVAYPLYIALWDQKTTFDELTEIADAGRRFRVQDWKAGQMGATANMMTTDLNRRPILKSMFKVIRICNMTIENIHRVKDIKEDERNDFMGQAFFLRGYAHFSLHRMWGPMPHVDHVIGEDPADWDMERPTANQAYRDVAADMDSAFKYLEKAGKVRRDLADINNYHRPSGAAAKAIKARALLYAASPLNNANGDADWRDAAVANWEAIDIALKNGHELMNMSEYSHNYLIQYSKEQIFAYSLGNGRNMGSGDFQGLISGAMANKTSSYSGECPTQNMVDKFEVIRNGVAYPLNTQAERDAATAAGAYNEQNPYINRDPRFYNTIIYNQATIQWAAYSNKAQIWYQNVNGTTVYGEHRNEVKYQGTTRTGYYSKKHTGEMHGGYTGLKSYITDPLIRLGELYLNYAEAANEAYGPNGTAPGAGITSAEALNIVRRRATMPDVAASYLASKEIFRDKIKLERTVELCFEGFHHYFDLRRWKDAPEVMSKPLIGVHAEKLSGTSPQYPTGYKYTRYELPADRQPRWKNEMYYIPFDTEDYYKMKKFDTSLNGVW